jgi:rhamnogalacturonyl hydrolase YesR
MPPFMGFKAAVLASSLLLALPSLLFFDGWAPSAATAWESYAFGSALWGRLSNTWVALDCVCDACFI